MRVEEAMNLPVCTCTPETDLATVTSRMRDNDCGMLPVVDGDGRVVGVITDRDVCLTLGGATKSAARISVGGVMTRKVFSCRKGDPIEKALETIASKQVRRLPVLDDSGRLCGILSMNDVVLRADAEGTSVSFDAVVRVFKELCGHRMLAVRDRMAVSTSA